MLMQDREGREKTFQVRVGAPEIVTGCLDRRLDHMAVVTGIRLASLEEK